MSAFGVEHEPLSKAAPMDKKMFVFVASNGTKAIDSKHADLLRTRTAKGRLTARLLKPYNKRIDGPPPSTRTLSDWRTNNPPKSRGAG